MNAPAPSQLSVVGRNVSAALLLLEMSRTRSAATPQLTWLRAPSDLAQESATPQWLLLSSQYGSALRAELPAPALRLKDFPLFTGPGQRTLASDFLSKGAAQKDIPLAIRRRCLAVGAGNDLTPRSWIADRRHGIRPRADWPQLIPLSMRDSQPSEVFLLPVAEFLGWAEEKLRARGVELRSLEEKVVSVYPRQTGGERHRLVMNAPFASHESDSILWTAGQSPLREEKGRFTRLELPRAGHWLVRGAWVSASEVAALPLFSLWLEESEAGRFLKTGFLESGALKRVFAIPPELHGRKGHETKVWLQFEELVLETDSPELAPLRELMGSGKKPSSPSALIDDLCPRLSQRPENFASLPSIEETLIYQDPEPLLHRYFEGIRFWRPGSARDFSSSAQELMGQLVTPRPAATR